MRLHEAAPKLIIQEQLGDKVKVSSYWPVLELTRAELALGRLHSHSHPWTTQIGEQPASRSDDTDLVTNGQQLSAPHVCIVISTLLTDFHSSEQGADTSSVQGGSSGCTAYRAIHAQYSTDYRLTIHTPHHLPYQITHHFHFI